MRNFTRSNQSKKIYKRDLRAQYLANAGYISFRAWQGTQTVAHEKAMVYIKESCEYNARALFAIAGIQNQNIDSYFKNLKQSIDISMSRSLVSEEEGDIKEFFDFLKVLFDHDEIYLDPLLDSFLDHEKLLLKTSSDREKNQRRNFLKGIESKLQKQKYKSIFSKPSLHKEILKVLDRFSKAI